MIDTNHFSNAAGVTMTLNRLARSVLITWNVRGSRYLLRAVRHRVYSRNLWLRLVSDLDSWVPPSSPDKTIEVRRGRSEELDLLRSLHPNGTLPIEFYVDGLRGAEQFWLARNGGEVGGIGWVLGPEVSSSFIELGPDEREIAYAYVFPNYRNQGVHKALRAKTFLDLKAEGVRRVYAHVLLDNIASLRAMSRLGMRQVGELEVRRILGVRTLRFKSLGNPPCRSLP